MNAYLDKEIFTATSLFFLRSKKEIVQ